MLDFKLDNRKTPNRSDLSILFELIKKTSDKTVKWVKNYDTVGVIKYKSVMNIKGTKKIIIAHFYHTKNDDNDLLYFFLSKKVTYNKILIRTLKGKILESLYSAIKLKEK